jgi:RNA polymerase sigma factor for flagellar operon FliA
MAGHDCIAAMLPLAGAAVRNHRRRYTRSWEREEMISDALFAGVQALPLWDPTRGATWQTFVSMKMRYGLLDSMRERGILTRHELATGVRLDSLPVARCNPLPIMGEGEVDRYGVWEVTDPHSEAAYRLVLDRIVIRSMLDRLHGRERDVILRTYLGGEVLNDLAREWGVTESRVSQIRTAAITQMRVWMHEAGPRH